MFQRTRNNVSKLFMILSTFVLLGFIYVLSGNQIFAASNITKFDFGNGGTVSGYTQVTASTGYTSSRGYGFNTPANMKNVSASGSGVLSDAVQFVKTGMTSNNTFNVDLSNGLYQVTVTLGNTARTSIAAEGVYQVINMTGNNATASFIIPITDGQLNILATEGKAGYAFTLSAMEIKKLSSTPTMPQTIWVCGDSTVCNYYPLATSSQCGWAQLLGDYVDSSFNIQNLASGGQYAKGFMNSGQFASVLKYIKKGDYYVISIGINDGNYSNQTEYYESVTSMVKQAKAKGATVILVKQQGRATDVSQHPDLTGRWYGSSLDTIGKEQNVKVVDLFNLSFKYYKSIGQNATTSLFLSDGLHPNRAGAKILAKLVADDVKFQKNGTTAPVTPTTTTVTGDTSLNGKVFMLKNVNSGLYMDVEGGKAANATNVQQWGASSSSAYNTWRAQSAGNGYYYLYSQIGDGKTYLLDLNNGSKANGTNIQIYQNTNSNAQLFKFQKNSDGTYTILTSASGDASCVEVVNAYTTAGANVQQWVLNGHNCQKWQIVMASAIETVAPTQKPTVVPSNTPVPTQSAPASTKPVSAGNIKVEAIANSWDGGYNANFTLTNQSAATVNNWTLKLKKSDFAISGSWNVTITESGSYYIMTGADWNKNISGNGSASFGFTATGVFNSKFSYEVSYDGGSTSGSGSQTPTVAPTPTKTPVVTPTPTKTPAVTPTPTKTPVVTPASKPTVYIAGDSTVQTYKSSAYPQQGWGAYLQNYFNSNVTVANRAIAGRSSKSFVDQGRLDSILSTIKKGDYLLVQFGINDAGSGNAERYAPVGDGSKGTFQYYIKKFVEGALNKGATPVLVTTTLSLKSYSNGKFVNSYGNYCQAMKDIAKQYKIPCIDLNTLMVNQLNKVGYNTAYNYYMCSSSSTSSDKTHFTETGAKVVASLVANGIKKTNTPLAGYVK